MIEINFILEFIKNCRMNDYFLNKVVAELEIGLVLAEYLNPDSISEFEPDPEIKNGLLSIDINEQMRVVDMLYEQLKIGIEFRSPGKIKEALNYLVPIYFQKQATERDRRRKELQEELLALDG